MNLRGWLGLLAGVSLVGPHGLSTVAATAFTVCTFNVENYCGVPKGNRAAKTDPAKQAVVSALVEIRPDILALQEVCSEQALTDLRERLGQGGLRFPHWEFVPSPDPYVHVAVLSRFPITRRNSHTNESFILNGRRHSVGRGFGEVDIELSPTYRITLLVAHLKSKVADGRGDETELREQEAVLLREKIEARLKSQPQANLVLAGDLNDTKDSLAIRTILGRGARGLVDLRPAERDSGDPTAKTERRVPRNVAWTYHYPKEDTYSRIDYLLVSPGLAREWKPGETYIPIFPDWGQASDHRPLVATFEMLDR